MSQQLTIQTIRMCATTLPSTSLHSSMSLKETAGPHSERSSLNWQDLMMSELRGLYPIHCTNWQGY
jgi:hypothetical protein